MCVRTCYFHFYVVIIWTRIALYFLYNSTFVPGPDTSLCISVFCIITVVYAVFTRAPAFVSLRIALYFLYKSIVVPGPDPSLCISVFCIITVIYAIFTFLHGPRRLPPFSHTIPGSLLLVF